MRGRIIESVLVFALALSSLPLTAFAAASEGRSDVSADPVVYVDLNTGGTLRLTSGDRSDTLSLRDENVLTVIDRNGNETSEPYDTLYPLPASDGVIQIKASAQDGCRVESVALESLEKKGEAQNFEIPENAGTFEGSLVLSGDSRLTVRFAEVKTTEKEAESSEKLSSDKENPEKEETASETVSLREGSERAAVAASEAASNVAEEVSEDRSEGKSKEDSSETTTAASGKETDPATAASDASSASTASEKSDAADSRDSSDSGTTSEEENSSDDGIEGAIIEPVYALPDQFVSVSGGEKNWGGIRTATKWFKNDEAHGSRNAYCINYSRSYTSGVSYSNITKSASAKYYAEMAYVMKNGATYHGKTSSNPAYSYGNADKDYYITQCVIWQITDDYASQMKSENKANGGHGIGGLSVPGYTISNIPSDASKKGNALYQAAKAATASSTDGYIPVSYRIQDAGGKKVADKSAAGTISLTEKAIGGKYYYVSDTFTITDALGENYYISGSSVKRASGNTLQASSKTLTPTIKIGGKALSSAQAQAAFVQTANMTPTVDASDNAEGYIGTFQFSLKIPAELLTASDVAVDISVPSMEQYSAWFSHKTAYQDVFVYGGGDNKPVTLGVRASVPLKGKLTLKKSVSDPYSSCVRNNRMYSPEGAVYKLYSDKDCKKEAASFTTKADGTTDSVQLTQGTYYLKETKAPKGYKIDTSVKTVSVSAGQTNTFSVQDEPAMDTAFIRLMKKGTDGKALAGAEFTIRYYDAETAGGNPMYAWVLKTDSSGTAALSDKYRVSSSDRLITKTDKTAVIPIGTYTIQETKAPDGYKADNTISTYKVARNSAATGVTTSFVSGNPSYITYNTSSRVLTQTDRKPVIGTTARDGQTNGHTGTAAKTTIVDTVAYKDLIPGSTYTLQGQLMDQKTGRKYLSNGKEVTAQTSFKAEKAEGSVPMTFTFDASGLGDHSLVVFETLSDQNGTKEAEHSDIKDEGQTVRFPLIRTNAVNKDSGEGEEGDSETAKSEGHVESSEKTAEMSTITDTVSYYNLVPGEKYTVSGKLMDKDTGKPLTDASGHEFTAKTTFTPKTASSSVELAYTVPTKLLKGKTMVVFEDLYTNGIKVATHSDLEDEGQTVRFPVIGTTAVGRETNDQVGAASEKTAIIDTVSYSGVKPGKKYTVKGRLMDRETGKALLINEREITSQATFIPEKSSGTVEVTFTLNASGLDGRTLVVFEQLYDKDVKIASHEEIGDVEQSIYIPEIHTTAQDGQTKEHTGAVCEKTTIVDTVTYSNLVPDKKYTVRGTLMQKETGKTLKDSKGNPITAETEFTAKADTGSVRLTYTLDSSILEGKTVVVFEDLLHNDITVTTHADINDADQSVHYPDLKTNAAGGDGSTKELEGTSNASIIDTISFFNLLPGQEYKVRGTLMNKTTGKAITVNDRKVTAETSFTPDKPDGTARVSFQLDASMLGGIETVVFENLYHKDVLIGTHSDLNDRNQTLKILSPPEKIAAVKTGDDVGRALPIAAIGIISAAAFIGEIIRRRVHRNGASYKG